MPINNERFDIPIQSNGTRRVSPTDLAQHERLDSCARFLRLRLYESNAGRGQMHQVMRRHGVQPQAPTPLPAVIGQQFETQFNRALAAQGWSIESLGSIDALHNLELIRMVRTIAPGDTIFLLQANLEVTMYDWHVSGRPDLMRIHRRADGRVEVLIADIKSAFAVKNEHTLQVAIYHVMLESLFNVSDCPEIITGVVHQIPHQLDAENAPRVAQMQAAAQAYFGIDSVCLDVVRNPQQLRDDAFRLFTYDTDSPLQHASEQHIDALPFAITTTCEGCGFMELCMAHIAQQRDIALVPYMDRDSRRTLRAKGVTTYPQLADLKLVDAQQRTLVMPTTNYALLQQLGRDEQIGHQLDVLIARAQQIRNTQLDRSAPVAYLPLSTPFTLPKIDVQSNPDAVVIYLDVHHDHLGGSVWQIAALVERHLNGVSVGAYPVVVVSPTVPDTANEAQLLTQWLGELAQVWQRHIGAPAPIHLVVYEPQAWHTFVTLLGRHYDELPIARHWHDFVTSVPSIDGTKLMTVLHEEVKANNRIGTHVPSLMAVAGQTGFRWQDNDYDYRAQLRTHHFDAVGKMTVTDEFYTARARFSSNIPLEYAYAAWNALPPPTQRDEDVFASYRHMTLEVLRAYSRHRLLGMQQVAKRHGRWFNQRCVIADIRTLAATHAAPTTLIGAMTEFMQYERYAEVANWLGEREHWPEDRVRLGLALMVEFRDEWQDAPNRERLTRLRQAAANNQPIPTQQVRWRVRVSTPPTLPDLATQIGISSLAGEQSEAVMSSLLASNGRVVSPRQLLHYAMRIRIVQRTLREDGTYELLIEMNDSQTSAPYGFNGQTFVPGHGQQYVLDASPDNIPGGITNRALQNLAKEPYANTLYRHLIGEQPAVRGLEAQYMRAYVDACEQLGGPVFTGDAKRYVMEHHDTRLLLVQGPPGTGKTFTTAHAIMARVYAAMMANRPLRIAVSCQTHAAVYAVMSNLAKVKQDLLARAHPFAEQLRNLRLYRYKRTDEVYPAGMVSAYTNKQALLTDVHSNRWCVVGATPTSMESLGSAGDTWCDLLILDEASQMSLPQAVIAAQPLANDGMVIVVGDPRQMPAIVSHTWESEQRRIFTRYPVYRALFDYLLDGTTLLGATVPIVKLDVSYRVPPRLADFLRHEIYQHDGINFRAAHNNHQLQPVLAHGLAAKVLDPDYPLILIEHDESDSRSSNRFEAELVVQILLPLIRADYNATTGFGVVVPHRLQRSTIRELLRPHMPQDPQQMFADVEVPGIDTVERYQGSERHVMIVSATESLRDYIQRNEHFLFDMRRLNVALSRAQRKVIVIASRQVLGYMARDVDMAQQSQMWKNYRNRWCTHKLDEITINAQQVIIWGGHRNPAD
ncbi:MAG: AAA domain-containing protein [Roseiflexaceae bacterium]